ncbi:hypothetical protein COOONC_10792 [Cooperia oncophora]
MTASAAASAMFNLTEDGQPISVPIFTVPKKDDYLCVPRLECPFVLREMTELLGISDTSPPLHIILLELFKQGIRTSELYACDWGSAVFVRTTLS